MPGSMVLAGLVSRFTWPGYHYIPNDPLLTWSCPHKYLKSVILVHCLLSVLFTLPDTVTLSHRMVLKGLDCPCFSRASLMIYPSFVFTKSAPNFASVADTTSTSRTSFTLKIVSLSSIGCLLIVLHPTNKCPRARLFVPFTEIWGTTVDVQDPVWLPA